MAAMKFRQFLDFMNDAEKGTFCSRVDQGVPLLRLYGMIEDMVDPNDPTTSAALASVMSSDRLAALQAYQAPPLLSFLQFMALFTQAEQATIVNSTDTVVKLFTLEAAGTADISLSDPRMIGALGYMVSKGILTADRQMAILANTPP